MKKAMIRVGKGLLASTRTTLSRKNVSPATVSSLEATYMHLRTQDMRDKYSGPLPSWELDHMEVRRIDGSLTASHAGPSGDHTGVHGSIGSYLCTSGSTTELKAHWIFKEK